MAARHGCREMLAELSRYLEGDMAPAERRRFQRHLGTCSCCARCAGDLERTIALCRQMDGPKLPADVRRRARQRIAALLTDSTVRS